MANVLLITLDQFRADCLSVAGHALVRTPNPEPRTPNLDASAADGVRFTHHFNQCAPCGPSRASLHNMDVPSVVGEMFIPQGDRWGPTRYSAEHSETAFLTNELLTWIGRQDDPWFAHASYIRPHPPS